MQDPPEDCLAGWLLGWTHVELVRPLASRAADVLHLLTLAIKDHYPLPNVGHRTVRRIWPAGLADVDESILARREAACAVAGPVGHVVAIQREDLQPVVLAVRDDDCQRPPTQHPARKGQTRHFGVSKRQRKQPVNRFRASCVPLSRSGWITMLWGRLNSPFPVPSAPHERMWEPSALSRWMRELPGNAARDIGVRSAAQREQSRARCRGLTVAVGDEELAGHRVHRDAAHHAQSMPPQNLEGVGRGERGGRSALGGSIKHAT